MNGLYYIFHYNRLVVKRNYVNNKKNDISESYYENGALDCVCNYVNDKKNGLFQSFTKEKKLRKTSEHINGLRHGLTKYYDKGKLIKVFNFNNDILVPYNDSQLIKKI